MAGRAAKRNIGGGTWYSGGNSNVASEAKQRADGGAVDKKAEGGKVKRAYGGRTMGKHGGFKAGGRLDKRARGGRLANLGAYAHGGKVQKFATGGGADKNPFSSAGAGMRDSGGRAAGGGVKKK